MSMIEDIKEWFNVTIQRGDAHAYLGQFIVNDFEGIPTSRIVAVRAFGSKSIVFFGNSNSRKVDFINSANGNSAMLFCSMVARRQMCIQGKTFLDKNSKEREKHWLSHPMEYRRSHLKIDKDAGLEVGDLAIVPDSYVAFVFVPRLVEFMEFGSSYQHDIVRNSK